MPTTQRINLKFDRLTDGTLVAVHQGVAAIVHPWLTAVLRQVRWTLAGDGDWTDRPTGAADNTARACAEAAEALGVHLGVTVDGYEIAP